MALTVGGIFLLIAIVRGWLHGSYSALKTAFGAFGAVRLRLVVLSLI